MERRKALAVAGTVGVTLAAATAAVFANVSLLSGAEASNDVGQLDAQDVASLVAEEPATTETTALPAPGSSIVYVDEYVTVPAGSAGAIAAPGGVGAAGAAVVAPPVDGTPTPSATVPAPATAPSAAAPAPAPTAAPQHRSPDDGWEDEDHEDEDHQDEDHEDEDEDEDEHEWEGDDD